MRVSTFSEPANGTDDNEDWMSASSNLIVMLDGATTRTETGCAHGVSWYVANLGSAIVSFASDPALALTQALSLAILEVAKLHSGCNLSHPGTPSAATAILRATPTGTEYLILGDITVVLDGSNELEVITDNRVNSTATTERAMADSYPIGSAEKQTALLAMKRAELAARNQPDGYWIAAANPTVVAHAITGNIPGSSLKRAALLTDGAARAVSLFALCNWSGLLETLSSIGPSEIVQRVRAVEAADPEGRKWPRNKRSDDATIVFATR